MTTIKTLTAALALTAFATSGLTAVSASAGETKVVSVSYGGLDLGSDAGKATFDQRIMRAVEKVCGKYSRQPESNLAVRRCQTASLKAAMKSRDLAVANYKQENLASRTSTTIRVVAR